MFGKINIFAFAKKVPGMREVQEIEAGGTEDRKEVELPNFSKRQLSTFEAVFFTEEQVKKCEAVSYTHLTLPTMRTV